MQIYVFPQELMVILILIEFLDHVGLVPHTDIIGQNLVQLSVLDDMRILYLLLVVGLLISRNGGGEMRRIHVTLHVGRTKIQA